MIFRTEIFPKNNGLTISYRDSVLLIGSCFAENIGNKMKEGCFNIRINPSGILFNPGSVAQCINTLVDKKQASDNELFYHQGLWHSFNHHSRFSHPDLDTCLSMINQETMQSSEFLNNASLLVITFGTAWVYENKNSGSIVANCHKLPAAVFRRRLLTVEEIVDTYTGVISLLRNHNPDINILFTLSPIRHLKDGAEDNSLSKAILRTAIHGICQHDKNTYFPSYELIMDDLRDYRFYQSDHCHPSKEAIDYIWEKFSECYFDKETKDVLKRINDFQAALHHRPFNPSSDEYLHFLEKQIIEADKLYMDFPLTSLATLKAELLKRKKEVMKE